MSDLINIEWVAAEVAEATGKTKKDSKALVETVLEAITKGIQTGNDVRLSGFGTFKTPTSASRSGTDPKGNAWTSEPKRIVKFKAASALSALVADTLKAE